MIHLWYILSIKNFVKTKKKKVVVESQKKSSLNLTVKINFHLTKRSDFQEKSHRITPTDTDSWDW